VLRRISGHRGQEVDKIHNEGVHNLNSSLNTIRVTKSLRIKQVGKVHAREEGIQNFNQKT
jgi:hypothetical protein